MSEAQRKIFGFTEKLGLGVVTAMIVLRLLFWDLLKQRPLLFGIIIAAVLLLAVGFQVWRNYQLVGIRSGKPKELQARFEGILNTVFRALGYNVVKTSRVEGQETCWAVLRDSQETVVVVCYLEISVGERVLPEQVQNLFQQMNLENAPKGVCLTTGSFDQGTLELARRHNILTKDGDQLLEMIGKAEDGYLPGKDYFCRSCGSKLEPSGEITGLMECLNPDCGKIYSVEELEEEEKIAPGDEKTFIIDCYSCSRPVEIDTTMSGLMECPYEDCSWIINVDNELLALGGGLDKKVSERLTEIKCPRCDKIIKVPADAQGLMECPCEEKWIIDVGAALGERAQAQVAGRMGREDESGEEHRTVGAENKGIRLEPAAPAETELISEGGGAESENITPDKGGGDCPQPDSAEVIQAADTTGVELKSPGRKNPGAAAASSLVNTARRLACLSMSTGRLLIFFFISITAFITFVYLTTY